LIMSTEELPQSFDPTVIAPMANTEPQTAAGKVLGTSPCRWTGSWPGRTTKWTDDWDLVPPGLVEEYVETTGAVLGGRDGSMPIPPSA
jgi:hypothetical protein